MGRSYRPTIFKIGGNNSKDIANKCGFRLLEH